MQIPDSSIRFAFNIFVPCLFAAISYLLDLPVYGHRLTIGRLTPFAARDIRYEATIGNKAYAFTFQASSLEWRFHLPCSDDPRWCTITINSIYYTSTSGDVSTARLETILWFFPVLFRFTAGPWANITIDDLRVKVFKSTETPYFIQLLRRNLVSTILTGEILRADLFRTSMRFAGLTERPEEKPMVYIDPRTRLDAEEPASDEDDADVDETDSDTIGVQEDSDADDADSSGCDGTNAYATQPLKTHDDDEMAFNIVARQLHVNNREGRIYTFGRIDSQIRRDWAQDRGSFAMVAEECRWVHVHFPFERVAVRSWWTQLASSLFHFPIDLVRTFNYPASSINLYVSRVDVTFDTFRLRDAELLKQGFSLIREKSLTSQIDWSEIFLDMLTQAVR